MSPLDSRSARAAYSCSGAAGSSAGECRKDDHRGYQREEMPRRLSKHRLFPFPAKGGYLEPQNGRRSDATQEYHRLPAQTQAICGVAGRTFAIHVWRQLTDPAVRERIIRIRPNSLHIPGNCKVRGLVHFSAKRRDLRRNRRPKTWTCPLRVGTLQFSCCISRSSNHSPPIQAPRSPRIPEKIPHLTPYVYVCSDTTFQVFLETGPCFCYVEV